MPFKSANQGRLTDRICNVMKFARSQWVTAREVSERFDYAKPDYVRRLLNTMHECGLLEQRKRPVSVAGPHALEYRVAPEWRNE